MYASLLAGLNDRGGAGYNFTLPDLLAARDSIQRTPEGEFLTPVKYTYRETGTPYVPGQLTPPVAQPTVQAATGGMMFDNVDPTSGVMMLASGGIASPQDLYGMLIKQGYTPDQAKAYISQQMGQGRSRKSAKENQEEGLMGLAKGGNLAPRYLKGGTDGMADQIPAKIGANQPAALSHGEFVIPADVVSHLGNGNSEAGAKVLYNMMDRIRKARTGTTKQGKEINPNKFTPKG
jgi:hypothetical protein